MVVAAGGEGDVTRGLHCGHHQGMCMSCNIAWKRGTTEAGERGDCRRGSVGGDGMDSGSRAKDWL